MDRLPGDDFLWKDNSVSQMVIMARMYSIRESALLQTFPRNYNFVEPGFPLSIKQIGAFIGNSVPVKLATVIGESIQRHVKEHYEQPQV